MSCFLNDSTPCLTKFALAQFIGATEEELADEAACTQRLEKWLRTFRVMDTSLIETFLDDVDSFSPDMSMPLLSPEEAVGDAADDTSTVYVGIAGLRRAILRFLYAAIQNKKPQLLLYSDQNMAWMVEDRDFAMRWVSLMSAYVNSGGKIQIIHNVDRGLGEMLAAIRAWLPLYVSGNIESWYCLKPGGERFFHTQFLEPEDACIEASFVIGGENETRYSYHTQEEKLAYFRRFYKELLRNSRPLFRAALFYTPEEYAHHLRSILSLMQDHPYYRFYPLADAPFTQIRLSASEQAAQFNCLVASQPLTFTATHPMMCRAFVSFAERLEEQYSMDTHALEAMLKPYFI